MPDDPFLVVGLGNPGPAYAGNRHNVGAMVARPAGRPGPAPGSRRTGRAPTWSRAGSAAAGRRVVLAKPRSYMNESGGPVAALLDFYNVPVEHLVVVHDELDLPFGAVRLKRGGGDGGHNGLRSITRALGTGTTCGCASASAGRRGGRTPPTSSCGTSRPRAQGARLPPRPGRRRRRGPRAGRPGGRPEPLQHLTAAGDRPDRLRQRGRCGIIWPGRPAIGGLGGGCGRW